MSQKFHIFSFFQSSFLPITLFIYSDFNLLLHVHHEHLILKTIQLNTMFLREYINLFITLFILRIIVINFSCMFIKHNFA